MQPEVIAERRKRKNPRSREKIQLEILKAINNGNGMKRTEIANKLSINYLLATELTDVLEKNYLITRSNGGEYKITQQGWEFMDTMESISKKVKQ